MQPKAAAGSAEERGGEGNAFLLGVSFPVWLAALVQAYCFLAAWIQFRCQRRMYTSMVQHVYRECVSMEESFPEDLLLSSLRFNTLLKFKPV